MDKDDTNDCTYQKSGGTYRKYIEQLFCLMLHFSITFLFNNAIIIKYLFYKSILN